MPNRPDWFVGSANQHASGPRYRNARRKADEMFRRDEKRAKKAARRAAAAAEEGAANP